MRLPTGINIDWTDQINPMFFLAVQQEFGTHIARIHQMLLRTQRLIRQVLLDRRRSFIILFNGESSFYLHNEMRLILVAGFGQMDLVADLLNLALAPIAGFRIKRRANPLTNGRHSFPCTMSDLPRLNEVLLFSDLSN
ncbi:hypothetical protein TFLX_04805 [Thermoflexales bacterium]|nr:hypothetical protein TFLX_04805 [Thermoflexales bacterium]